MKIMWTAEIKNLKKLWSVPCKQSLLSVKQAMLLEMETLFTLMKHDFSNDLHESTKTFTFQTDEV